MNKKEVEARKAARENDSPRAPKGEKPYDATPCLEWDEEIEVRNSHLCLSAPTAEPVERAQGAMPPVDSRSSDAQKANTSSQGAMPLVVAENNNRSTQGAMPSGVAELEITQRGTRGVSKGHVLWMCLKQDLPCLTKKVFVRCLAEEMGA